MTIVSTSACLADLWLRYNIRKFSLRGRRLAMAASPKGHRLVRASSRRLDEPTSAPPPEFFRLHQGVSLQSETPALRARRQIEFSVKGDALMSKTKSGVATAIGLIGALLASQAQAQSAGGDSEIALLRQQLRLLE